MLGAEKTSDEVVFMSAVTLLILKHEKREFSSMRIVYLDEIARLYISSYIACSISRHTSRQTVHFILSIATNLELPVSGSKPTALSL